MPDNRDAITQALMANQGGMGAYGGLTEMPAAPNPMMQQQMQARGMRRGWGGGQMPPGQARGMFGSGGPTGAGELAGMSPETQSAMAKWQQGMPQGGGGPGGARPGDPNYNPMGGTPQWSGGMPPPPPGQGFGTKGAGGMPQGTTMQPPPPGGGGGKQAGAPQAAMSV